MAQMPANLVERYNVSRESQIQICTYVDLLLQWQQKINLIGPSTIDQVWHRHVADALQLVPLLGAKGLRVADLGSGAGFPGLVLAMSGCAKVHLFESVGKKVSFMREVARQTGVPAEVHQMRLEQLSTMKPLPLVDVVTARALAPLTSLLAYAEPFLQTGARGLFHKGQDIDTELQEASKAWQINYNTHQSTTDSQAVVLEVMEVTRCPIR